MTDQETNFKYAGSFRRSAAAAIDMFIANFIRMTFFTIMGEMWIKQHWIKFGVDFKAKFNSDIIGNDPEKIQFLISNPLFKNALIFCFLVFMFVA